MKGTISKTVVTTLLEVNRYNEETKTEETVTRKFMTLRTPSHERIETILWKIKATSVSKCFPAQKKYM